MAPPHFGARGPMAEPCPDLRCRRSGQCRAALSGRPCARTHDDGEEARFRLAAKLDRIRQDYGGTGYALDPADPDYALKLDRRLGTLKEALKQADAAALAAGLGLDG